MLDSLKEKYLIFKAAHGSPEAFASIFDRYFQKIYRFVYFRVGTREDAEDLTSDVFLQFQSHLNRGGEVRNLSGLLYQIARNKVIDFYRSRKIDQVPLQDIETGEEMLGALTQFILSNASEELAVQVDINNVMTALGRIKTEYREVVMLHYVAEMTIKEIAEALEKKENNIRVMLFRALSTLRETLNNKNISDNPCLDQRPSASTNNAEQEINQNFKESTLT